MSDALNVPPKGLTGILTPGDGATFILTADDGNNLPATLRLIITDHAGIEQTYTPTLDGITGTWLLTVAQVTALVGTLTAGSLKARLTTGTGDLRRGSKAGRLSILSRYAGSGQPQSLGTITLGPPGPAIASGIVDEDGALVLTLENAVTLDPIALPPLVGLTLDGDGDYETTPAGTAYLLTTDADGDYNVRTVA